MDYINEHVWRAYGQEQKSEAYRLYMAENLRCIAESTAKFSGGPYMTAKWADIINQDQKAERKPGETAASIIKGAGLTVVSRKEAG